MTESEINLQIAEIEALDIKGVNEAGQVFIAYGKHCRIYNPVRRWDEAGKLIEKHSVSLEPVDDEWLAKCDGGNEVRHYKPLVAVMIAIIEGHKVDYGRNTEPIE